MLYGERIISRLHDNCALRDEDNDFREVFINTIGAILDDYDLYPSMESPYLQNAEDVFLDLHGKDLGVRRKFEESDDHYRLRIIYEVLGYLTVQYLLNVYDLTLYTYIEDFDKNGMTLTSDNPYINGDGFMSEASEEIQNILENKFVLEGGVEWIT